MVVRFLTKGKPITPMRHLKVRAPSQNLVSWNLRMQLPRQASPPSLKNPVKIIQLIPLILALNQIKK